MPRAWWTRWVSLGNGLKDSGLGVTPEARPTLRMALGAFDVVMVGGWIA
jgi:hypothetical protein